MCSLSPAFFFFTCNHSTGFQDRLEVVFEHSLDRKQTSKCVPSFVRRSVVVVATISAFDLSPSLFGDYRLIAIVFKFIIVVVIATIRILITVYIIRMISICLIPT